MKISLMCLILLFSLYTISSFSSAAAQPPAPVFDTERRVLQAGVDYYILSVIGGGGGLTQNSTGRESCPLNAVVQDQLDDMKGLHTYFRPADSTDSEVRISTDLNIVFNVYPICGEATLWTLDFDESTQRNFVSTGGVEGNPGRETISNWFKIEEFESGYKFVYCPSVCDTCKPVCGDLSILVQEDSTRRLVLSLSKDEQPFTVQFQRFDEDEAMPV